MMDEDVNNMVYDLVQQVMDRVDDSELTELIRSLQPAKIADLLKMVLDTPWQRQRVFDLVKNAEQGKVLCALSEDSSGETIILEVLQDQDPADIASMLRMVEKEDGGNRTVKRILDILPRELQKLLKENFGFNDKEMTRKKRKLDKEKNDKWLQKLMERLDWPFK